jgi:hypothetical protein
VDSGVDSADASSVSVVGGDAGLASKESSHFKEGTRKAAEFGMPYPYTHHIQRPPESPATVSRIHMYFVVNNSKSEYKCY